MSFYTQNTLQLSTHSHKHMHILFYIALNIYTSYDEFNTNNISFRE